MVNYLIQENQFTEPEEDQCINPEEFLRLTGAAVEMGISRRGDQYRLEGTFVIGPRRTLRLVTSPFSLAEGHTLFFPRLPKQEFLLGKEES